MERTRTGIIANIIDFIQAFKASEVADNGRVTPEELSKEEKQELKAIIGNNRGKNKDKKDPVIAVIEKYGPAKPGNPIYDTARKMSEREEKGKEER